VKWLKNKIFVGYHEWARSLRTQGYSVYAITIEKGLVTDHWRFKKIGETQKRPKYYEIPPNTKFVLRVYRSNSGLWYFYLYFPFKGEVKEIKITERKNFEPPTAEELMNYGLPENEAKVKALQLFQISEILKEATLYNKDLEKYHEGW